jgi:hypothetical protein
MPTDPNATAQSSRGETPQHEPRVPGGKVDEPGLRQDHPNKPFRTPSKNKTHAAPDTGTDGDPDARRPETSKKDAPRKN